MAFTYGHELLVQHDAAGQQRGDGGAQEGHVDAAFVDTIVRLATSLELGVVAEGIELSAQADAVARLGCGFGQGYFFGAPYGQLGVTQYLTAKALPSSTRRAPSAVAAA